MGRMFFKTRENMHAYTNPKRQNFYLKMIKCDCLIYVKRIQGCTHQSIIICNNNIGPNHQLSLFFIEQ